MYGETLLLFALYLKKIVQEGARRAAAFRVGSVATATRDMKRHEERKSDVAPVSSPAKTKKSRQPIVLFRRCNDDGIHQAGHFTLGLRPLLSLSLYIMFISKYSCFVGEGVVFFCHSAQGLPLIFLH